MLPPVRNSSRPSTEPISAILILSLNAAQFASQFASVPGLAPALGAVQSIISACAKIQSNKKEIQQLQERCRYLIIALNDYEESSISYIVDGCTAHLMGIHSVLSKYVGLSKWKSLCQQQLIANEIQYCHASLDDCCREFGIRSNLQLHQWMDEYQRAQRDDRLQLLQHLTELKEDNASLKEMVAEGREQINSVLILMQSQLGILSRDTDEYRHMRDSLYNVQKRTGELLPDVDLRSGEVQRIGHTMASGNLLFDVWEGLYLGKEKVAMKTLRSLRISPSTRERFKREAKIWREVWAIDHGRYILPFYGFYFEDGPHPYMISPWMNNGDVTRYVRDHPEVNRLDLIRGVAEGLRLLHNLAPTPIVHGDIKGANIFIDDSGQPLLADFGLSKFLDGINGVPFTSSNVLSESFRWFAPELSTAPATLSTRSDIFAFSMTVLEIFTGERPFSHIKLPTEVLIKMQLGERPKRPASVEMISKGLDDHLWEMLNTCWATIPEHRPSIDWFLAELDRYT